MSERKPTALEEFVKAAGKPIPVLEKMIEHIKGIEKCHPPKP